MNIIYFSQVEFVMIEQLAFITV